MPEDDVEVIGEESLRNEESGRSHEPSTQCEERLGVSILEAGAKQYCMGTGTPRTHIFVGT